MVEFCKILFWYALDNTTLDPHGAQCKKITAMVFNWGDRGYPIVRFEYKQPLRDILLLRYKQQSFG